MPYVPILHVSMPGSRCGSTSTTSTVSPCTSATSGFTNNFTEITSRHLRQKRREEFCRSAELLSLLVLSKPAIVNFCPQCLHARTLYATPTKCRIQHFRLFSICRIPFQRQHLHRSVRPLHGSAKRASLSRKLSVPDIPRLKAQIKKREPSRLPLSPGTNP